MLHEHDPGEDHDVDVLRPHQRRQPVHQPELRGHGLAEGEPLRGDLALGPAYPQVHRLPVVRQRARECVLHAEGRDARRRGLLPRGQQQLARVGRAEVLLVERPGLGRLPRAVERAQERIQALAPLTRHQLLVPRVYPGEVVLRLVQQLEALAEPPLGLGEGPLVEADRPQAVLHLALMKARTPGSVTHLSLISSPR